MPSQDQSVLETIQRILGDFSKTLAAEKEALSNLNYMSIDENVQRKLELQSELEFALESNQKKLRELDRKDIDHLKESLVHCRLQAKHNDAMISAYQAHIQKLQDRLSGKKQSGYGPKKRFLGAPTSSNAILTDSIG